MKETFVYLQALTMMALVLSGLGGVAYNVFRDGGWIETTVASILGYTAKYPLIVTFVVIGGIAFVKWWRRDHSTRGSERKGPTVLLYLVMAAGAYYIGHFAIYGTL